MTLQAAGSRRLSPLFLVIGLVLGWVAGVAIAWAVSPFSADASTPSDLKPELKSLYVEMISAAYARDGDAQLARERVAALGQGDPGAYVARVSEAYLDAGASLAKVRQMARLAQALGGVTSRLMAYLATPVSPSATPSPTATSSATATPPPTMTLPPTETPSATSTDAPTATPSATDTPSPSSTPTETVAPTATLTGTPAPQTYSLVSKQSLCRQGKASERIAVYVQDSMGNGAPGVRVTVAWPGGEESLYTGLKPEVDPGYADFVMTVGVVYTVHVGLEGSDIAEDLSVTAEPCPDVVGDAHRQWELTFRRRN